MFFFFQAEDGIRDKLVTGVQTCALPISRRGVRGAQLWTTVTTRPIEARTLPTRTHSASGPILTTALPVFWTCQAISQPSASLQAIAFWSCFTTCSKVGQSQLCRIVIHGGATVSSATL